MTKKGETMAQEGGKLIRLFQCGQGNGIRCSTKPCLAEHLNLEMGLGWFGPWWEPYLCPVGRSALFSSTWYLHFMQGPRCLTSLICCQKNQKKISGSLTHSPGWFNNDRTWSQITVAFSVSGVSEQTRWVGPAPSHDRRSAPSCASLVLRAT